MKTAIYNSRIRNIRVLDIVPIVLIVFLSVIIAVIISCSTKSDGSSYTVVKISGECDFIYNLTKRSVLVYTDSTTSTAVLSKEGDLIVFDDFIHYYDDPGETEYQVRCEDSIFYLNERIASIILSDENEMIPFLDQMDESDMEYLRSLFFIDEIPAEYMQYIKDIASHNPDIGLLFGEVTTETQDVLDLFSPEWIFFEEISQSDFGLLFGLDNTELIYMSMRDSVITNPLPELARLKRLFIGLNNDATVNPGFLENNPYIETLVFSEYALHDFSMLKDLENLRELSLLDVDETLDIDFIKLFRKLETLVLMTEETDIKNIEVLSEIPSLKWLVLGSNLVQEEFNTIIENHNSLEIVELIGCENITDLSILTQLSGLYGLSIADTLYDHSTTQLLTNLKYLSLPIETFEDSTYIALLQNELPDCTIVANHGICLGSGWLFLVLPLVILFMFTRRKSAAGKTD